MIDQAGALDVIGVVSTVAIILCAIGWSLKRLYAAQEAEELGQIITRRRHARLSLRNSPVARTASRK